MNGPTFDDRDMDTAVRSWLNENDEPTPARGRQIGRILGRVDEVPQRRRFWPLNPFGRRADHEPDDTVVPAQARIAALTSVRAMSAVALAVLVGVSLMWVASRPVEQRMVPGGWPVDPTDRAVFEGFIALWAGDETDLTTTPDLYAEDAAYQVLRLDSEEVVRGDAGIRDYALRSLPVDYTKYGSVRLDDDNGGAHRYLLVAPARQPGGRAGSVGLAGAACVLWVEDEQIARHDCVLPTTIERDGTMDMVSPDPTSIAQRETLSTALAEALSSFDREALERVASADIEHHVLSANQIYTLEGIDAYWTVMSARGMTTLADVDLPAPEGELRWADFSSVGSGTLCVFRAQEGLITRHDCIVPSATSVSSTLTEITAPPE